MANLSYSPSRAEVSGRTTPQTLSETGEAAPSQIFLIDDHPIFREGLKRLLETENDLEVCGEAGDQKEALEKLKTSQPDLVIVDVALAGTNGIDLIGKLRKQDPALAVLVLSMHPGGEISNQAMVAGAQGYLSKDTPPEKLVKKIRQLCKGGSEITGETRDQDSSKASKGHDQRVELLSDRELGVLRLIGQGLATREIAERIGISGKTVETHRGKIRRKLDLGTGPELLQFAATAFKT